MSPNHFCNLPLYMVFQYVCLCHDIANLLYIDIYLYIFWFTDYFIFKWFDTPLNHPPFRGDFACQVPRSTPETSKKNKKIDRLGKPRVFLPNPWFPYRSRVNPMFGIKPEENLGFRSLGYIYIYVYLTSGTNQPQTGMVRNFRSGLGPSGYHRCRGFFLCRLDRQGGVKAEDGMTPRKRRKHVKVAASTCIIMDTVMIIHTNPSSLDHHHRSPSSSSLIINHQSSASSKRRHHHQSSTIHHPSSIIHHPSSIIHHHSSFINFFYHLSSFIIHHSLYTNISHPFATSIFPGANARWRSLKRRSARRKLRRSLRRFLPVNSTPEQSVSSYKSCCCCCCCCCCCGIWTMAQ